MKRDMDLCRKILLELENAPSFPALKVNFVITGYSQEEVSYHVMLLAEAGLIVARNFSSLVDNKWEAERLTWDGCEFLDTARDNVRWEKAKTAMALAGGFALDVMKQLLIQYLKTELKLT